METRIVLCLLFVFITSAETTLKDDCCENFTVFSSNPFCLALDFRCGNRVTSWPDYEDFYKYSECKGSECFYCFKGGMAEPKPLWFEKCQFKWLPHHFYKDTSTLTILRTEILSHFRPSKYISYLNILPLPWGSVLQTYYNFDKSDQIFTVKPEKSQKLPWTGRFIFYVHKSSYTGKNHLNQVTVTWYSPVLCNITYLLWKNPKDPLLSLDCTNEIQWPIVFEVSNSYFEIKDSCLYLKDLTARGPFTLSITAMFVDLKDSVTFQRVYVEVGRPCQADIRDNINWPKTFKDFYAPCTKGFSGNIRRSCSINGKWGELDYSMCVKNSIMDAKSLLSKIASAGGDVGPVMAKLANATKDNLGARDISETMDALDIVSNITNTRKHVSKKDVQGFVDVVNNLVGEDTKHNWRTLHEKNNLTVASMLKRIDDFGRIASQKINRTVYIKSENLVLELKKISLDKNIKFPSTKENQKDWAKESNTGVFVPLNILQNAFNANESVAMNAALFKNMKDLLPKSRNDNKSMNSYVLSISFGKPLVNLTGNISLIFSHLAKKFKEPSCNFWDFKRNLELGGSWSNEGCEVLSSNSTHTVCICDHLTNFAILMKPAQYNDRAAIGIITYVFCSVSVVALVLTMISYGICWKFVASQDVARSQSILLMNLCVSLIIGYVIFLTLVEKTGEKIACTIIAALIHYFFLVCFFTMLAEGIDMVIALTVVFTSRISRIPLLIAFIWGGPAIIVGVTLAITRTKGFGNELFCWLTYENNINLAFIVPVLIIIVANIICLVFIVKALFSAHCMLRKSIKQRLRIGARSIGILTPSLGFTWIFGVLALNEDLQVFEYIFTVANSLQGFFIFLVYCIFNKNIQKNLWKKEKTTSQSQVKQSTDGNLKSSSTKLTTTSEIYFTIDDAL